MKKNILKTIVCLCLIGLVWSCTTENDVQMQSPDNSSARLKDGSIWDSEIGQVLGDGTYRITADQQELIREIERISADEGDDVKITSLEIVDIYAVNDPDMKGIALNASTGNVGMSSKTMSFELVNQSGSLIVADPFGTDDGGGRTPKFAGCRGCGQGCFPEYYKLDGHLIGHCVPAGCGDWCAKIMR